MPSPSLLEPAAKAAEVVELEGRESLGIAVGVGGAGGRRCSDADPATFGQQLGLAGAASGLLDATRRRDFPLAATARAATRIVSLAAAGCGGLFSSGPFYWKKEVKKGFLCLRDHSKEKLEEQKTIEFKMASFLRRYLIESDLTELASATSPIIAGALFGAAAWSFGDACAMAAPARPPTTFVLPPLFALFSLVVLALVPRSYLASLDEGGGVFDTGEGMSSSARAKVLLFLAWGCSFGSAAGGVALAAGSGGDATRSRLASGSLTSTILTLVAGMVLWFGRGGEESYGYGY